MTDLTLEDALQSVYDTFGRDEVNALVDKLRAEPQEETHTCEYVVNTKTGGAKICGKAAKNENENMWFCGTDKSGHYKSIITASKKELPKKPALQTPVAKTAAVKQPPQQKGVEAKTKTTELVQKLVIKEKLDVHEIVPGSGVYADLKHHRITFHKPSNEAYGILGEDNETILPLTEDAITFLEAHNVKFKQPVAAKSSKPPTTTKVVAKPQPKPVVKQPVAVAKTVVAAKPQPKPVAKPLAAVTKPATAVVKVQAKPVVQQAKVPVKPTPQPKVVPVKIAKSPKPVEVVEDETLEELKQGVEDSVTEVDEAEPNPEEVPEEIAEDVGVEDIDLGVEEEEPEVEEQEEVVAEETEETPDIDEVDEGEAVDDNEEEQEIGED